MYVKMGRKRGLWQDWDYSPAAYSPPKMRHKSMMPMIPLAMTALTGVLVFVLTCFKYLLKGKQSSRAYAKVTLLAAIIQACPMKNW